MSRHFEEQLEKLRTRVIKMSSLVDEQVEFAIRAIEEESPEIARLVIERDRKVDSYDLKIDKICQKIFALNQPVAMDLRLIMSSMTINGNLERIGDIAANIASNFLNLGAKKPEFFDRIKFREMAVIAKEMIKGAIDSYIDREPKLAQKVIESDDRLDLLNHENHQLIIDIMKESPDNIEPAVSFLVACRNLERLGDHATNIAEDVYFITEAQVIKHNYEKFLMNQDGEEEGDQD